MARRKVNSTGISTCQMVNCSSGSSPSENAQVDGNGTKRVIMKPVIVIDDDCIDANSSGHETGHENDLESRERAAHLWCCLMEEDHLVSNEY